MAKYEVVVTQRKEDKGRVIHMEFSTWERARDYADDMVVNDNRTVSCSIYKNNCLLSDKC